MRKKKEKEEKVIKEYTYKSTGNKYELRSKGNSMHIYLYKNGKYQGVFAINDVLER